MPALTAKAAERLIVANENALRNALAQVGAELLQLEVIKQAKNIGDDTVYAVYFADRFGRKQRTRCKLNARTSRHIYWTHTPAELTRVILAEEVIVPREQIGVLLDEQESLNSKEAFLDELSDPRPYVRQMAVKRMLSLNDLHDSLVQRLYELYEDDDDRYVRLKAAEVLRHFDRKAP